MRLRVPAATARVTADDIRAVERKISGRSWSEFLGNCALPDRCFCKFLGFKRALLQISGVLALEDGATRREPVARPVESHLDS